MCDVGLEDALRALQRAPRVAAAVPLMSRPWRERSGSFQSYGCIWYFSESRYSSLPARDGVLSHSS